MKIYVVTKGSYSDYHIVAATLDKEKAEKIAKKYSDGWDDCEVEEYEDSEEILKTVWFIIFKKNTSDIDECREVSNVGYALHHLNEVSIYRWNQLSVYIAADTMEEAIKIASEKRAEYLAKKEGVC